MMNSEVLRSLNGSESFDSLKRPEAGHGSKQSFIS